MKSSSLTLPLPLPPSPSRTRGFSFVELMFAVVVMGIGFIMIAAVFPVGLQQTKVSLDESTAASGSRGAMARLQQIAQAMVQCKTTGPDNFTNAIPETSRHIATTPAIGATFPGIVRTLNDPRDFPDGRSPSLAEADMRRYYMWQLASKELISPADARNATAIMYKRDSIGTAISTGAPIYGPASSAQIISINAQVANTSAYTPADVSASGPPLTSHKEIYNLEPRPVGVQIIWDDANQTYVASFTSVKNLDGGGIFERGGYPKNKGVSNQNWDDMLDAATGCVTEGAFIVISDDRFSGNNAGRYNGHVYKLGNRRTDITAAPSFDLAPGYTFTPDPGADGIIGSTAKDDIVGIGVDDSNAPSTTLSNRPYSSTFTLNGKTYDATASAVVGTAANHAAVALVLGRGFADPAAYTPALSDNYTGPAMDVAIYTSFVSVP